MAALEALLGRDHGALVDPARRGHRPFRHGAGAEVRSGAEVRLAPARARRAGGLAGRRRPGAGRTGRRSAVPPRRRAMPRPRATGTRCSRRRGSGSGPGRRASPKPPTWRRCGLALTGAARSHVRGTRGWPDGRGRGFSPGRGKSGLQGEMAAGNARPGQPEGKRHREETAAGAIPAARVKRWGKSPPRRRQRRWHGKPRQEQGQIGIARGLAPRVSPARAVRVGCPSPPATAGPDEWPSAAAKPSQNPAYRPSARLVTDRRRRSSGDLPGAGRARGGVNNFSEYLALMINRR